MGIDVCLSVAINLLFEDNPFLLHVHHALSHLVSFLGSSLLRRLGRIRSSVTVAPCRLPGSARVLRHLNPTLHTYPQLRSLASCFNCLLLTHQSTCSTLPCFTISVSLCVAAALRQ